MNDKSKNDLANDAIIEHHGLILANDDPALMMPLAPFAGKVPPAPHWFNHAMSQKPERFFIEVEGARIDTFAWGRRGAPGLMFLHGNGAHAEWWSFIAPFFAEHYRVIAPTWSGMGNSDWREKYSIDLCVQEILTVGEAAGLFESETKPVLIGHSMGGAPVLQTALLYGERLRAVITMDSVIFHDNREQMGPQLRTSPNRLYPTQEEALSRFRLSPIQPCENFFILDHIARRSIKYVEEEQAWTWRFDPFMFNDFEGPHSNLNLLKDVNCPVALMRGEQSVLVTDADFEAIGNYLTNPIPLVVVPESQHHLMLDQPLAVVAALRSLLTSWP